MRALASIICLLGLLACSSVVAQNPKGLYCPEPSWDFGEVGIDFDIFHVYRLVNGGHEAIWLDSVQAPCDCSLARVSDSSLKPGDTALVTLKFSTKDFYGRTTKAVDVYYYHSSDTVRRYMQLTYLATVGQYFGGLKPEPVNLFFLPAHTTKKLFIPNPKLRLVEISKVEAHTSIADIKLTKPRAAAGEKLELDIIPQVNLKAGTYVTNFRLTLAVEGEKQPLLITIPMKIVRY